MAITLMTGTLSRTEPAREARGARRIPIGGALTIAIVAASALSGCSGGVSKRQITDAINEHLKGKACFSLQDLMPTTVSAEEQHVRDLEQQISAMMSQAGRTAGMTGMDTTQEVSALVAKKEKLEKELVEARKKLLQKKAPDWPMRVRRQMGLMSGGQLDPILTAMQAAGYLQITQEIQREGFALMPVTVDVITPTETAKGWWDVQEGFCVGTRAVADVQEWTEPGKDSGVPLQVSFTWHLTDVPSWANRAEFKDIQGMTTPVEGMTILQKTNKGWKAVL